ncbi:serine/threonine-protein kinase Sgk2 [Tetranychus urticae]|uniref:serine/threonine-protein kinase Sgk2 n=1 Tax=Tetranychus urticae TaxID=32264 RepID=UPI00077BF4EF|nr:serine/threonine-protein kinase Sgk2 [Tetranychus urticae]XP_015789264.1 serine/threonine-protein kinase Sgk2 [Tetranychus urticae]
MVDLSRWDRWKVKLKLGNSRRNKTKLVDISPSSDHRSTDQSSSTSSSDENEVENMSVDGSWPSEMMLASPSSKISKNSARSNHSNSNSNKYTSNSNSLNSSTGLMANNGNNGVDKSLDLGPSEMKHAKPSDFEFLKVIGHGSFGKVLIARHKAEEKIYAVKVLQKKVILKKNERNNVMCERNVLLKNLNHPFLVGLHYSFQSRDKLYFVLDYVNGGELFFHLQRDKYFSEPRARFYAAEITSALGYLHSQGIVYRDLKPENILLDSEGHVVLTDFGLCKDGLRDRDTTSTFCGTPEYLAPEVLRKEAYDRRVDWWCLGAVLYEMLYGLPPFYSRDTVEMYDNILNKPVRLRTNISLAARSILEGLLQKDKRKRLGSKNDADEIKRHDFFKPIVWTELESKQIIPPFNPNVKGYMDLRNIDPDFTKEPVPQSVCKSVNMSGANSIPDNAFPGFSYAETTY